MGEMGLKELVNDEFENAELRESVLALKTSLVNILTEKDKPSWRIRDFKGGGRARQKLAQHISHGPFTVPEFKFIWRVLEQMFMPKAEQNSKESETQWKFGQCLASDEPQSTSEDDYGEYFASLSNLVRRS